MKDNEDNRFLLPGGPRFRPLSPCHRRVARLSVSTLYTTLATFAALCLLALIGSSGVASLLDVLGDPVKRHEAKLLWWDAWVLGRITEEELMALNVGCRDFLLGPWYPRAVKLEDAQMIALSKNATQGGGAAEVEEEADADLGASIETDIATIPKNIYYLHYNEEFTTFRYLCSIESAARRNPAHTVTIHAANAPDFETKLQPWRSTVPRSISSRVRISDLKYEHYFRNTPLEEWYKREEWKKSHWVGQNLGNAYRLALLWHEGGMYMDLDIIMMNPLEGVGRAMAREDHKINNAALHFPAKDPFLWDLMEEFVEHFNGYAWWVSRADKPHGAM
ncbi:hypothetical protein HK104_004068 [Borealophlyctis nickersoniae]|nr:hypothetical protein HK104_004068 [Borealophlyctis nickersoniae]